MCPLFYKANGTHHFKAYGSKDGAETQGYLHISSLSIWECQLRKRRLRCTHFTCKTRIVSINKGHNSQLLHGRCMLSFTVIGYLPSAYTVTNYTHVRRHGTNYDHFPANFNPCMHSIRAMWY